MIYSDHITSYLALNIRPVLHIYSFSESDWCSFTELIFVTFGAGQVNKSHNLCYLFYFVNFWFIR